MFKMDKQFFNLLNLWMSFRNLSAIFWVHATQDTGRWKPRSHRGMRTFERIRVVPYRERTELS